MHAKVKGSKEDRDDVFDPIHQLCEIQKGLEYFDEVRDYIVCKHRALKYSGDE